MTDRISLNADIDCDDDQTVANHVSISFNVGDFDDITDILVQFKRFLISIGYEWVEAVNVTAHDPETGNLVMHSTDPIEEWEDMVGEPEGTA